ncbi:MAG: hypothetical protein ACOYKD_01165 [Anaerolineaceae bacterium]|jgi:hypothetical protein
MDEYTGYEQLEKRVEWLDNERRNDKTNLASLQNRLAILESENITLRNQLKEMGLTITKLSNQLTSLDKYENRIDRLGIDLTKQIRDVNERADMNLNESIKRIKIEVDSTKKTIADIYPLIEQLESIRAELNTHKLEDTRLARIIEELKQRVQEVDRFDEDYRRSLQMVEENRRQDAKRTADLQGEVIAVRKRVEETRSRLDSFSDSFRQLDLRIAELLTFEKDRKEAQSDFIDRVNALLVEKDKTFKFWEQNFSEIEKVNLNLNAQMAQMEASRQAVSKAISGVDEITQRFERRINEITEIQRLNENRFRQEWTSFKSDDVKRWTNYVLGQEEIAKDFNLQIKSNAEQIQALSDLTQQNSDDLERLSRETLRHIQTLLVNYQETIQQLAPILDKKGQ